VTRADGSYGGESQTVKMKIIQYDDILKPRKKENIVSQSMRNKDPNDFFTKQSSELSNPAINRDSMVFYSAASIKDTSKD
jgi:hypothetical protein